MGNVLEVLGFVLEQLRCRGTGIGLPRPAYSRSMPFVTPYGRRSLVVVGSVAACGSDGRRVRRRSAGAPRRSRSICHGRRRSARVVPGGLVVKVTDASGRAVRRRPVAFAVTPAMARRIPRRRHDGRERSSDRDVDPRHDRSVPTKSRRRVTRRRDADQVPGDRHCRPGDARSRSSPQNRATPAGRRLVAHHRAEPRRVRQCRRRRRRRSLARDPTLIIVDANGPRARAPSRRGDLRRRHRRARRATACSSPCLPPGNRSAPAAADADRARGRTGRHRRVGPGFCVHASSANTEYALVPYYNSGVPSATTHDRSARPGRVAAGAPVDADVFRRASPQSPGADRSLPDDAFETSASRARARRGRRASPTGARLVRARGATSIAARQRRRRAVPAVGDLLKLNVERASISATIRDFAPGASWRSRTRRSSSPTRRNPAGGFTDAEYRVDRRDVRYARRSGRSRRVRRADATSTTTAT